MLEFRLTFRSPLQHISGCKLPRKHSGGCCDFDGVERSSDAVCADEDRCGEATDMAAEAAAVRMPAAALTAPLATDEMERLIIREYF